MFSIPAASYSFVYIIVSAFLALFTGFSLISQEPNYFQDKQSRLNNKGLIFSLFVFIIFVLYLGFRPAAFEMGDTVYYIHSYKMYEGYFSFSFSEEWLWKNMNVFCKSLGLDYSYFFVIVAFIYVGSMIFFCINATRSQTWVMFLFFITSLSFYGYGINGIRNGMACSILLIAIIFLKEKNKKSIIGFWLLVIAYFIHRSTLLPSFCLLLSLFVFKNTKASILFWVLSILLSLIIGNVVGDYIGSTGIFDDKANYFFDVENSEVAEQFSSVGFRWDFLIYSAMPILLVHYLTIKRNFNDSFYNIIVNTYILSNSFWIIVIRAAFSNRFAYLSWFLYPVVIAYPFLRFNISKDQNINLGLILLFYSLFTTIMLFH